MRWLDGITDSMDVSLSELRGRVELACGEPAWSGVGGCFQVADAVSLCPQGGQGPGSSLGYLF